jgi:hypothetical protein
MTCHSQLVPCHLTSLLSLEGEEARFLLPSGEEVRACPEFIEGTRGRALTNSAVTYD